ncbi:MAG: NAD(P)/FAD-dependent oxidoreductase [Armatimonadota bacterium]
MDRFEHVILGGGMVAGFCIREMVEQGVEPGTVCMVSMDEDLPYERPPLSKDFMRGEQEEAAVFINEPGLYEDHGIEVHLNTRVRSVDFDAREVSSKSLTVGFENLLIATGAWPRELDLPGADLQGIHLLRTLAHSKAIQQDAADAGRAVIVGGGFIGMEVAASLTVRGVDCTLVYPESHLMAGRFTDRMADYFQQYYTQRGVRLLPRSQVRGFEGEERVTAVTLGSGQSLPADMVVLGVGVSPETGLFEDSPLQVDDGIVVNEYLETDLDGVWVAGDVARYMDIIFERMRRFEHEDNARFQGPHAARAMLGDRQRFEHVPQFYSDIFDLSWNYWGDRTLADRVVYRGEVESGTFVAWWVDEDGRVMAAFTLGIPWQQGEVLADIIRQRAQIPEEVLTDESRELVDLVE